ncbi:MAG: DEAD/DEAH box helicase, partial [Spirochaetota bacterium]|nr:DEAD/DEAH box helicase [Spirochaetota bacterium]
MTIEQLIEYLKNYEPFMKQVAAWHTVPARQAVYAPYPDDIDERIRNVYMQRGIENLYSHQRSAYDAVQKKENIVVVTPTASGKTLCYNLPVLNFMAKHPDARALYLFPTKALSQDQLSELQEIMKITGLSIKTYTFDGDTPQSARKAIRTAGNIVITNPDMLHSGILPHHTIWVKLFENLQYVVVDEIHTYKGVFGSHFANLMRRLKRICSFYGSHPQFICCSATIANPKELAEKLFEMPFTVIDNNGAPRGKKHFVIYNPPVVDKALGIRASAVKEAAKVGTLCVKNNISTIVFCRSRLRVEIIATYLKEQCKGFSVAAYRGGYLPNERRSIEKGLREKKINAVVSTNALELGIDIGMLDCAISVGYPGSIASLQQQSGRAGRRGTDSLAIMVATSSPLDQYIATNPHFVFENNPEMANINPDNLLI